MIAAENGGDSEAGGRFPLGRLAITQGAADLACSGIFSPAVVLSRHAAGDWGDICDEDKGLNDDDLENGGRLLSAYDLESGGKLYVITEWDRSATTILLAEEY